MAQLTHNPLANPPAPRGMRYAPASEPDRTTWLGMARQGLEWNTGSPRVVIEDASTFLNRAIEHGRLIKEQLDAMPADARLHHLSTPTSAIRLRVYLAAAAGQLVDTLTVSGAMRLLGITDQHGRTRGEWQ